jgi:Tol biopolymer transport system component
MNSSDASPAEQTAEQRRAKCARHESRPARPTLLAIVATCTLAACAPFAARGGEPVRLTRDGIFKSDPVCLADGRHVVFVTQADATRLQLVRLDLEDGSTTPLHPEAQKSEFDPAFSRDDRWSAFVQSRGNLSLALVIRDAKSGTESEVKPAVGFSGMRSPAVSPDGTRVVYSFPDGGRQNLVSVDMQAGNPRKLTDGQGVDNWPHWSPDGKRIVFGSTRDGDYEIHDMRSDGSDVRRLTRSPRQDVRPRFAPDGRRIAFVSHRDGNAELYVMQADGSGVVRLTEHPERDDYPAWLPDGRSLVFVGERDGQHDLYRLEVPES